MTYRQRASLYLLVFLAATALKAANQEAKDATIDVLTNRYDNWRSGANLREAQLTVQNVSANSFGKLFERQVDGDAYAQPLIKSNVKIASLGPRNVVYVATTSNDLYAFDADRPSVADPYWHVGREIFGEPVPRNEVSDLKPPDEYLNFETTIGVVSSPVIDDATSTIYVVAKSKAHGEYSNRIFAFDLSTGRQKTELGSPATIGPVAVGNGVGNVEGKITMDGRKLFNRTALLLQDGILYLAFGAHGDGEPRFNYRLDCVVRRAHPSSTGGTVHYTGRNSRRRLAERRRPCGGTA